MVVHTYDNTIGAQLQTNIKLDLSFPNHVQIGELINLQERGGHHTYRKRKESKAEIKKFENL